MKRNPLKVAALAAVGLIALTACSAPSTAPDETAIQVGSGITEGSAVKDCIPAGTREVNWGQGTGDKYYYYPENQRSFDFLGNKDSDAKPIEVVSKDGQSVTVPGTINFDLITDCETLTAFHNNIGRKNEAYMVKNDNGDYATGTGWLKMMNQYIAPSANDVLDQIAKQYDWRELRSNPAIKDEMNAAVNKLIEERVNARTDGKQVFFANWTTQLQQPIADPELAQTVKAEELSRSQAQADQAAAEAAATTARVKAEADAAAAEAAARSQVTQKGAELEVKRLEAEIQRQVIAPYGSPENYVNNEAVKKGINPFQPSFGSGAIVDTTK